MPGPQLGEAWMSSKMVEKLAIFTICVRLIWQSVGLDADAEVYVLADLVAGVGVEIVRRAAVELVPLTKLATDEEAEGYRSEAGRDPAYGFDESGFFFGFILFAAIFVVGEAENVGGRDILSPGVIVAGCRAKPHTLDDSSGAL